MPSFDITLFIEHDQMFCANCSRTIKNTLLDYLKTEPIYTFDSVRTNFRAKTAEIIAITLTDQAEAVTLTQKLEKEIDDAGYECDKSPNKKSIVLLSGEDNDLALPSKNNSEFSSEIWHAIPTITLGSGLMLAEHMQWLPENDTSTGLSINISIGMTSTLLTSWIGKNYYKNAWRTQGAMDTLISLGTLSAIAYSFLLISNPPFMNEDDSSTTFSMPLMILGFLKLSHALRDKLHARIEMQIDDIETQKMQLPKVASVYLEQIDGETSRTQKLINLLKEGNTVEQFDSQLESEINVNAISQNAVIRIEPGTIVPIDGILLGTTHFTATIEEKLYGKQGDSTKKTGELIFAGGRNTSHHTLFLQTICEAKDNYLRKIYNSVRAEVESSTSLELVSLYFLRSVITTAVAASLFWYFLGPNPAISNAIKIFSAVMLSACPCGLGLLGIHNSVTKQLAFEEGILIQQDKALLMNKVTDLCFDKCGTLTEGEYDFDHLFTLDDTNNHDEYLAYAAKLEQQISSENHSAVAKAILKESKNKARLIDKYSMICTHFADNPMNKGRGGMATINDKTVIVGNKGLLKSQAINIANIWLEKESEYGRNNQISIFMAIDGEIRCLFVLKPATEIYQALRPDVVPVIQWFIQHNKQIHILTGDTQERTEAILNTSALIPFINTDIMIVPQQSPDDKENYVKSLKNKGKYVLMLGDEINDLKVINAADISVAIDNLAPIRGHADIVLNGTFIGLAQWLFLSNSYQRGHDISLMITFGINGLSLVAAAGAFYPITDSFIDPMITSMSMIVSSSVLLGNIALFQYLGSRGKENIKKSINNTEMSRLNSSSFFSSCCKKMGAYFLRNNTDEMRTTLVGSELA